MEGEALADIELGLATAMARLLEGYNEIVLAVAKRVNNKQRLSAASDAYFDSALNGLRLSTTGLIRLQIELTPERVEIDVHHFLGEVHVQRLLPWGIADQVAHDWSQLCEQTVYERMLELAREAEDVLLALAASTEIAAKSPEVPDFWQKVGDADIPWKAQYLRAHTSLTELLAYWTAASLLINEAERRRKQEPTLLAAFPEE